MKVNRFGYRDETSKICFVLISTLSGTLEITILIKGQWSLFGLINKSSYIVIYILSKPISYAFNSEYPEIKATTLILLNDQFPMISHLFGDLTQKVS